MSNNNSSGVGLLQDDVLVQQMADVARGLVGDAVRGRRDRTWEGRHVKVTFRDVPDEVRDGLREIAGREGVSVNDVGRLALTLFVMLDRQGSVPWQRLKVRRERFEVDVGGLLAGE